MNLLASLAIAVLVAAGVYAMLARDIVRLAAGALLLSNAALLFLIAASFGVRADPIAPMPPAEEVADPLVQALALTAIVINFGVSLLLLRTGVAVERSHDTVDVAELADAEIEAERRAEEGS